MSRHTCAYPLAPQPFIRPLFHPHPSFAAPFDMDSAHADAAKGNPQSSLQHLLMERQESKMNMLETARVSFVVGT